MNMEKVCEFCRAFRPVVYCQADAAHLCLSCDAKVHSANALSNRHLRSPLCDSCHYAPAYARCSDHKMYICHSCDQRIHDPSSPHKRQATSSYMGSPSASDFAALWDLDLRELGDLARSGPSISSSPNELKHWGAITSDTSGLVCPGESNKGSRNQKRAAVSSTSQWNQSSCFILQQIIDLRKLQLDEKTSSSSLDDQEQNDLSSSLCHNSSKLNKTTDQSLPSCQDLKEEAFPSPFSTIENLPSSSTSGAPWHSESLWQCRSPFQTSQLWAQNMQDLGLCEELACHDDFNIPEVDVTFRNFEELFGGEQDSAGALLDDSEVTWSPVDKHISPNTSESGHANLLEDASMAASTCINSAALVHGNSDTGATDQVNTAARILDRSCFIHRSYSALSPSLSRFSSESVDVDCFDSSISTHNTMEGQACRLPNDEMIQMEVRETSMMSSIDKPRRRTAPNTA